MCENVTLSVMRQVRNCLSSPTTITLLRKGISSLILFSMGTGGMLSPLDVIISSEGERGSNEKEVEKMEGEWWEEERKEEKVRTTSPFIRPVMYKKSPGSYSESG